MDPAKASAMVTGAAVARSARRSYDQPPWVLDDPFALRLAGQRWAEIQAASQAALPEVALRQSRASVVARSRYAEDRLISGGCRQYVILGAGLDSFAWGRADLIGWLRLFDACRVREFASGRRSPACGVVGCEQRCLAEVPRDHEQSRVMQSPGSARRAAPLSGGVRRTRAKLSGGCSSRS